MNVLESQGHMPWRVRPWVLVLGAVVVIAVVVFLTTGSSPPAHPGNSASASSGGGSGSGTGSGSGSGSGKASLHLVSSSPAAGAQGVASNTTITMSFSSPVTLASATPVLSPQVAGTWVQSSATTLSYDLDSPLIPSSREVVTVPGGAKGLRSTGGATLAASTTVSFTVAPGDTLRLQQLLAQLGYLPLSFTPSGPTASRASLAEDQAGSFAWRWSSLPTNLTSLWTPGATNEITTAAVETFENQNGLGVDGLAGPAVWTSLINDSINGKSATGPYVYVLVNKALPENLTLWNNGTAQYVGIAVNTGLPGADTVDGTFAVFEHVRFSEMKGTNPDGSHYDDPNVPYASYFNGGDALHGFIRASYGSPQSNGCVEMTYADAALVWPLTPIGTLVTVEGPNYGTAPPATTTTTTTAPPATTTTTTVPPATTTTAPAAATTTAAP